MTRLGRDSSHSKASICRISTRSVHALRKTSISTCSKKSSRGKKVKHSPVRATPENDKGKQASGDNSCHAIDRVVTRSLSPRLCKSRIASADHSAGYSGTTTPKQSASECTTPVKRQSNKRKRGTDSTEHPAINCSRTRETRSQNCGIDSDNNSERKVSEKKQKKSLLCPSKNTKTPPSTKLIHEIPSHETSVTYVTRRGLRTQPIITDSKRKVAKRCEEKKDNDEANQVMVKDIDATSKAVTRSSPRLRKSAPIADADPSAGCIMVNQSPLTNGYICKEKVVLANSAFHISNNNPAIVKEKKDRLDSSVDFAPTRGREYGSVSKDIGSKNDIGKTKTSEIEQSIETPLASNTTSPNLHRGSSRQKKMSVTRVTRQSLVCPRERRASRRELNKVMMASEQCKAMKTEEDCHGVNDNSMHPNPSDEIKTTRRKTSPRDDVPCSIENSNRSGRYRTRRSLNDKCRETNVSAPIKTDDIITHSKIARDMQKRRLHETDESTLRQRQMLAEVDRSGGTLSNKEDICFHTSMTESAVERGIKKTKNGISKMDRNPIRSCRIKPEHKQSSRNCKNEIIGQRLLVTEISRGDGMDQPPHDTTDAPDLSGRNQNEELCSVSSNVDPPVVAFNAQTRGKKSHVADHLSCTSEMLPLKESKGSVNATKHDTHDGKEGTNTPESNWFRDTLIGNQKGHLASLIGALPFVVMDAVEDCVDTVVRSELSHHATDIVRREIVCRLLREVHDNAREAKIKGVDNPVTTKVYLREHTKQFIHKIRESYQKGLLRQLDLVQLYIYRNLFQLPCHIRDKKMDELIPLLFCARDRCKGGNGNLKQIFLVRDPSRDVPCIGMKEHAEMDAELMLLRKRLIDGRVMLSEKHHEMRRVSAKFTAVCRRQKYRNLSQQIDPERCSRSREESPALDLLPGTAAAFPSSNKPISQALCRERTVRVERGDPDAGKQIQKEVVKKKGNVCDNIEWSTEYSVRVSCRNVEKNGCKKQWLNEKKRPRCKQEGASRRVTRNCSNSVFSYVTGHQEMLPATVADAERTPELLSLVSCSGSERSKKECFKQKGT